MLKPTDAQGATAKQKSPPGQGAGGVRRRAARRIAQGPRFML
jgi:hypothetical protein